MHNKRRQNTMNGGQGGGQHRHNNNRPRRFNNNRPQGNEGGNDAASISRTRRNATQNREKYQMMARDALSQGDRVLNEYYLQHADHYHRVLLALPPEEAPRQHFQQRNFNQQAGEQQSGVEHTPSEHPQDGAHPVDHGNGANGNADNHDMGTHPHGGHGLPSFITQPGGSQQVSEE